MRLGLPRLLKSSARSMSYWLHPAQFTTPQSFCHWGLMSSPLSRRGTLFLDENVVLTSPLTQGQDWKVSISLLFRSPLGKH